MNKKEIINLVLRCIIAIATAILATLGLQSCNVTRTIVNSAESYQRGDTTCTIVTKTIETYNAHKIRD